MNLGEFLKAQLGAAGPWNCSTMPADWCVTLGYPDFAAKWRAIVEPVECEQIAGGDLLSLWDEGIGDGLAVASAPYQSGDIAVVQRMGLQAGAIFTGERWALQAAHGLVSAPFGDRAILKAWRP